MAGHFGLVGAHFDAPVVEALVETHLELNIHALYRAGALVEGAETEIEIGDGGSVRARHSAGKFHVGDQAISVRLRDRLYPFQFQPVFECPKCGTDRYKLYLVADVWACRKCHGLDWACRHAQRNMPAWHRVRRLRERLGADLRPFSPLSFKPHQWLLAREIRALEARLIEQGHAIADVLKHYRVGTRSRSNSRRARRRSLDSESR